MIDIRHSVDNRDSNEGEKFLAFCPCGSQSRDPSHIILDCPLFTEARLTTSIITQSRSLTLRNLFSEGKYIPRLLQFLETTKAAARPPIFTATEVTELDADEGIG